MISPRVQSTVSSAAAIPAAEMGPRRGRVSRIESGLMSLPSAVRPESAACTGVVPRPMNGSSTAPPGRVRRRMKNSGSWALKQAR